ncbi:MAG TPA: NAD-dependent epimerase/dehydratase family protein, partial [Oligoflexia bacterium]|nr:NAD-dependent epimerase/dehydratase family protein [Oligoflexia bacterium]
MNILVAGHNGYIGSVMVRVLEAVGHDVSGIDTFLYRDGTFGKDDWHGPEIQKDIRDITPEDLAGFDAVVLLAALCNDPIGDLNPDWTFDINHAG